MKEKERFKEMLEYLKSNGINWGIEIHDHRIWHAIVQFPELGGFSCAYARGYSVLAHMDADLDKETKLVRGPLISLGRALKAEAKCASVAPVLNEHIAGYLLAQNCPTTPENEKFCKGQFNVKPTHSESWLLFHTYDLPNRQYGLPSFDPRIVRNSEPIRVPPTNDPFAEFLHKELPFAGRWVDRRELIVKAFRLTRNNPDASIDRGDFNKLFDTEWLKKNGLALEHRIALVRV